MTKKILVVLSLLAIALTFAGTAQAVIECTCFGHAYYNGQPVNGITVNLYDSRGCLIATQVRSDDEFFLGPVTAPTGYYRICIRSTTGLWYHATFYHEYDISTSLGVVNMSNGAHPADKLCAD